MRSRKKAFRVRKRQRPLSFIDCNLTKYVSKRYPEEDNDTAREREEPMCGSKSNTVC